MDELQQYMKDRYEGLTFDAREFLSTMGAEHIEYTKMMWERDYWREKYKELKGGSNA